MNTARPKKFALVDCNNFYASCERVFAPWLNGRPVVVLSNNDGCVIARSNEAKTLDIPMGAPAFKYKSVFQRHGVSVFSSNYALYGDMSARVMSTLEKIAPEVEIYSIDEAFLDLTGVRDIRSFCLDIRATVLKHTGIPVSVGIGPTKSLAKIGNRFAKKNPTTCGVFDMDEGDNIQALGKVDVDDVWGIGRRYAKMLKARGVMTAKDFSGLPRDWVQKKMTVGGVATLLELNGISCLNMAAGVPAKKTIVSSRSFGTPVTTLKDLKEAVSTYATRASEKLRRQGSVAAWVLVFLHTNKFKRDQPQYANSRSVHLLSATDYTPAFIQAALDGLGHIYRPGFAYKKAGIMLGGIEKKAARQMNLLDMPPDDRPERAPLMRAVDSLNKRYGRDTVKYASCGITQPWAMNQKMRSPRSSTCWAELATAKASRPRP